MLVLVFKAGKKQDDLIKHSLLRMQFSDNKNTEGVEMSTSEVLTSQLMASVHQGENLNSSKIPPLFPATVNSLLEREGFLQVDLQKFYIAGRRPGFSAQRCLFCYGKNLFTWVGQLMIRSFLPATCFLSSIGVWVRKLSLDI